MDRHLVSKFTVVLQQAADAAFEVQHLAHLTVEEKTEIVRIGGTLSELVNRANKWQKQVVERIPTTAKIPKPPEVRQGELFSWTQHEAEVLKKRITDLKNQLKELG